MFRSRWLLIQLNARRLELWDLGRPLTSTPTSYFDGLDGLVDGYKLLLTSVDSSTIALSVRSYKTYHIHAVLPQIGVKTGQNSKLVLLNIVTGCSGLLNVNNGLGVFSRSTLDTGAIAQCQQSAATIILQSEKEDPMLDYAPSAKIMTSFVIVVQRKAIEFYSLDVIQSAPLHWVGIPYCGPDAAYLGLDTNEEPTQAIHVVYPNTADGAGCRFTLSAAQEVLDIPRFMGGNSTALCIWGETGRRMVHVDDFKGLSVLGLSVPVGFGAKSFVVPVEDRYMASWKIPYLRRDLACYLAFDEAMGVCAVALGSGRIWIADPVCGTEFNSKTQMLP
ncbi:hypothetical protein M407DRAFT_12507 [Tulasnella calospora MUT 4182]|uniref:Cleavage/polyadenylation specificity factor A subunit N-terminal domain-containing protein n=1 Tax=Tulasnella calospora MUT 4182 TaxID=1051891 RepID=A0A0C3Q2L9_9AGAM|nr:hypothetical protein M407DRAFT_12507 [Tulasnella calospora MUT 4182]